MKCHHIGLGSKGWKWQKIMPMSLCTVMFLRLLIWELFAFEPEISFESMLTQDRLYNRVMKSFAAPKVFGRIYHC
jgi:hypothetical protein